MSTTTLDEEMLARVIAPPDREERCARCGHAQGDHIDKRDETVRECRWERESKLYTGQYMKCPSYCSGFILLFARKWPEDRLFQVKTEASGNWSVSYSPKYLIPLEYDRPAIVSGLLCGTLLFVFALGIAVGCIVMRVMA